MCTVQRVIFMVAINAVSVVHCALLKCLRTRHMIDASRPFWDRLRESEFGTSFSPVSQELKLTAHHRQSTPCPALPYGNPDCQASKSVAKHLVAVDADDCHH
jgi:hypothetical protein